MAQRMKDDKIGSLTQAVGVITLGASDLTIGGQQYSVSSLNRTISTDVTLAANTLYMVFAVVNSGVVELRISTNVNSMGPVGFSSWKLVGAFYSGGGSGFGTFLDINGVPASGLIGDAGVTCNITTNTSLSSTWNRMGQMVELGVKLTFGGAVNAVSSCTFTLPAFLTINVSALASASVGYGRHEDVGTNRYSIQAIVNTANSIGIRVLVASGTYATDADVTNTVPFTIGNTDVLDIMMRFPVAAFNTTPIKDL